jgi:hypothetical protein
MDLVGMRAGEDAGGAIARSVNLARHVERCGHRMPTTISAPLLTAYLPTMRVGRN